MALDLLVFGPHPDDLEIGLGASIAKHVSLGLRVGLCDLTQGEMGTRGTAEDRAREAAAAAKILKVSFRQALDIPDGRVENTWENRLKVARMVRQREQRV